MQPSTELSPENEKRIIAKQLETPPTKEQCSSEGKDLTPKEIVINKLNRLYGGTWNWNPSVDSRREEKNNEGVTIHVVGVFGELEYVDYLGKLRKKKAFGYARNKVYGNALKTATTDALKRAARFMGAFSKPREDEIVSFSAPSHFET